MNEQIIGTLYSAKMKEYHMFRRSLFIVLAAFGLLFGASFANDVTFAQTGARELVFNGSLQAENDAFDLPTIYIHGSGSGNASLLGQFAVTYDGTAHRENGVGLSDLTAQFVTADGDSIVARASGRGTPSETAGVNQIEELYTIAGGTEPQNSASAAATEAETAADERCSALVGCYLVRADKSSLAAMMTGLEITSDERCSVQDGCHVVRAYRSSPESR